MRWKGPTARTAPFCAPPPAVAYQNTSIAARDRGVLMLHHRQPHSVVLLDVRHPPLGELFMDMKSMVIGALAIGIAVLGYLYYDSQQSSIKIDLPGVKIEGK